MRESSSIRAHSGPPGTSNEAGWARLRGLSRWPQCPPAASTVQSQATEQEESSILSWSQTFTPAGTRGLAGSQAGKGNPTADASA